MNKIPITLIHLIFMRIAKRDDKPVLQVLMSEGTADNFPNQILLPEGILQSSTDIEKNINSFVSKRWGFANYQCLDFLVNIDANQDIRGRTVDISIPIMLNDNTQKNILLPTEHWVDIKRNVKEIKTSIPFDIDSKHIYNMNIPVYDNPTSSKELKLFLSGKEINNIIGLNHYKLIKDAYYKVYEEYKKDLMFLSKFISKTFTLKELQSISECIENKKLDAGNFNKKIAALKKELKIIETSFTEKYRMGKPAKIYKFETAR